ncbi:DUF1700 domain-containing protein [Candidatus Agathobaculum pullicola]|uniref:DUF1700 domain-containing protein n=1 Tax=Candidatus Agathobaculum pullicola TaxID=2838426 RepID=UPI003F91C701
MNRTEYMAALRRALSVLPEEERASALRYYEEYFDDAGPENEEKVIADLGAPEKVAGQILADYREVTPVPPASDNAAPQQKKRRWNGINPWLLVVLVLLAIPIGIPLAGVLIGLIVTVFGVVLSIVLMVLAFAVVVPLCLLAAGVILCGMSFVLWSMPASAVMTLGCGLALFALGVLLSLLIIKLCILFVPPLFRAFVALLRWPIDKWRGRTHKNGGDTK